MAKSVRYGSSHLVVFPIYEKLIHHHRWRDLQYPSAHIMYSRFHSRARTSAVQTTSLCRSKNGPPVRSRRFHVDNKNNNNPTIIITILCCHSSGAGWTLVHASSSLLGVGRSNAFPGDDRWRRRRFPAVVFIHVVLTSQSLAGHVGNGFDSLGTPDEKNKSKFTCQCQ